MGKIVVGIGEIKVELACILAHNTDDLLNLKKRNQRYLLDWSGALSPQPPRLSLRVLKHRALIPTLRVFHREPQWFH